MKTDPASIVRWNEINSHVDRYETAWATEVPDLKDYLPQKTHPLFLNILGELIRVDLEFRWTRGYPRQLEEYLDLFSTNQLDDHLIGELAFEEYRLRHQVGESPSVLEYESRFGIDTDSWPRPASRNLRSDESCPVTEPKTIPSPGPLLFPRDGSASCSLDQEPTFLPKATRSSLVTKDIHAFEGRSSFDPQAKSSNFSDEEGQKGQAEVNPHELPQTKNNIGLESQRPDELTFASNLAGAISKMPKVGEVFLDFLLVAELGRGAIGRVFLAHQRGLANRLVALKLSLDLHGEDQVLAQLQHTNIVPIHSSHKSESLSAVCMPYFGATTLADVCAHVGRTKTISVGVSRSRSGRQASPGSRRAGPLPQTGEVFAQVIASRNNAVFTSTGRYFTPTKSADGYLGDIERLCRGSYVDAVLLLAEQIAEGLSHSHERGIVHRDLKPGNILLTDEGRPMLLDFNLSEDTKLPSEVALTRLGGTLPYMSPEHLRVFVDVESVVDERSDIFALGVVLWELLAGKYPFATPGTPSRESLAKMLSERKTAPPRIRKYNPAVSPALESIVRKCMDPEPQKRYQTAKQLQEDLVRHRTNRWLKYARERSVSERIGKWVRRHPSLVSPLTLISSGVALAAIVFIILIGGLLEHYKAQTRDAEQRYDKVKKQQEDTEAKEKALHKYRQFQEHASRTEDLEAKLLMRQLLTDESSRDLPDPGEELIEARRALKLFRVLENSDWMKNSSAKHLAMKDRQTLKEQVSRLARGVAWADAWTVDQTAREMQVFDPLSCFPASWVPINTQSIAWTALRSQVERTRRLGDSVTKLTPHSKGEALTAVRKLLERWDGGIGNPNRDGVFVVGLTPASPRKTSKEPVRPKIGYAFAYELALEDKWTPAITLLEQLTQDRPDDFQSWLLKGLCHELVLEHPEAIRCYTKCIKLKPNFAWCYLRRGRMYLGVSTDQWQLGEDDLTRALEMKPKPSAAYVLRAGGRRRVRRYQAAVEDMNRAIRLAPGRLDLHLLRWQIRQEALHSGYFPNELQKREKRLADRDRQLILDSQPKDWKDWLTRGIVRMTSEPEQALSDLDTVLVLRPDHQVALFYKAKILEQQLSETQKAIEVLNLAAKRYPNHLDYRITRGHLLALEGKREETLADVRYVLKRDGASPRTQYRVARIYSLLSELHPRTQRGVKNRLDDQVEAFRLLRSALANGYGWQELLEDEQFRGLHNYQPFIVLYRAAQVLKDKK